MNVKISILIQMDPFERLNQNTDTTFCLIIEALKRNYKVMCCEPKDIYFENKKINAYASNLSLTNKNQIIKEKKQEDLNLSSFDVVLLRKDPPFDMNYITNTYLNTYQFQKRKKPFFINNPNSLRSYSEKIYPLYFHSFIPKTIISCNPKKIYSFISKQKKVVIKPLYLKGGEDIYMIEKNDQNSDNILKYITNNFTTPIVVQRFLEGVKNGDKRVILIDGEPAGSINRIPVKGDFRANLHLGGSGEKTELTQKEKEICKGIKDSLRKNGLFFVGIDIIDEKLTEINVTSPTGIVQINKINNTKIEKIFWDRALKKV